MSDNRVESADPVSGDAGDILDPGAYCRQIETYLCRKNGGHLVRVVGPAFEMVSAWAAQGVPVRIVFSGVDRYLQRQHERERGPRRRPVRIEFCEADILDAFEAWRRAVGAVARIPPGQQDDVDGSEPSESSPGKGPSLPAHLRRVQLRLSSLIAGQRLPPPIAGVIDDLAARLDGWHTEARGARGDRRRMLLDRLRAADIELMNAAWLAQEPSAAQEIRREAEHELAPFRNRMADDVWQNSVNAAAKRLLRERLGLPVLALDD